MPYANPKLAALVAEARHRRALRAGYIVLKVQRPVRSTEHNPPWLYSTEDNSIYQMLDFNKAVAELMGDRLKMYVYAQLIPAPDGSPSKFFEIFEGETVPEEFTGW
jgi:hypothetical protein